MKRTKVYTRRDFIQFAGLGVATSILAGCGAAPAVAPTFTAAPPTNTPPPPADTPVSEAPVVSAGDAATAEEAAAQAEVIVGDVVDYALTSDDWPGPFGYVTFQLHAAFHDGKNAYYIRTDASDPTFAEENKLVYVPLLGAALGNEDTTSPIYIFENGTDAQLPVLATIPGMDNFSSALRVHSVTFNSDPTLLDSAEAVEKAEADGDIAVEKMNLIVNYPIVKWEGGELSVDEDKAEYLGVGQLLEPVDVDNQQVTFKLHQCYPGSRYIVTDTSTAEMAPMMSISAAPPTKALVEAGGTAKIWVFGNGIEGSGVMGFQPAIFDSQATEPNWSPFWDHYTLVWAEGVEPRILKDKDDVQAALDANEVELFNGTPNSHPNGFVVNCPVPVLAPNTFSA